MLSKNVVEVSLVWWIVDKLKMGTPSVVAGNAKNAISRFTTTNEWKEWTLSGCQRMGHASNFLVIKSLMVLSAQPNLACF